MRHRRRGQGLERERVGFGLLEDGVLPRGEERVLELRRVAVLEAAAEVGPLCHSFVWWPLHGATFLGSGTAALLYSSGPSFVFFGWLLGAAHLLFTGQPPRVPVARRSVA